MILGEKPIVLLVYIMMGVGLACLMPLIFRNNLFEESKNSSRIDFFSKRQNNFLITLFAVTLLALSLRASWVFVLFSAIVSIFLSNTSVIYDGRLKRFIIIWLGLLTSTLLPWWLWDDSHRKLNLSVIQIIYVITLATIAYIILDHKNTKYINSIIDRRLRWLIYATSSVVVVIVVMSTGTLGISVDASNVIWHHWGAYIGPAQLVAVGAVPLHDIPVQYGLGPTLLLMKGCTNNCWLSLYWISGLTTLAMVAILSWLALRINLARHPLSVIATLIIVFASSLLWNAFPPSLNSPLTFPSGAGLRFLPGLVMLAWVVKHIYSTSQQTLRNYVGHVIWLLCIIWSPESAIHASAVWIPYFVWLNTFKRLTPAAPNILPLFINSSSILVLVLLLGVAIFSGIFRLAFGDWPLPSEYIAYILYPPGAMSINWHGTIWFALAAFVCWALGWTSSNNRNNSKKMQISWVVSLHCFSVFTYFLGRSHDNNILNLLPYLSLLLFSVRGLVHHERPVFVFATTLLATTIGWVCVFGASIYHDAISRRQVLNFAPSEVVAKFNLESSGGEDMRRALKYIRSVYREPIEVFDQNLLDGSEPQTPWSALHDWTNYAFFPSEKNATYVQRVATRLHKPGWIVYIKTVDMSANLLAYDSSYSRTNELDFGEYKAIRFVPK